MVHYLQEMSKQDLKHPEGIARRTGKSSTINALFEREVAKVGRGGELETRNVSSMEMKEVLKQFLEKEKSRVMSQQ